jgi:hypothetical protein
MGSHVRGYPLREMSDLSVALHLNLGFLFGGQFCRI